jgi:hypothetical protein
MFNIIIQQYKFLQPCDIFTVALIQFGFISLFSLLGQTIRWSCIKCRQSVYLQTPCTYSANFSASDHVFFLALQCICRMFYYISKFHCSSVIIMLSLKGLQVLFSKLHLAWPLVLCWYTYKHMLAACLLLVSNLSSGWACHFHLHITEAKALLPPIIGSVV